MINEIDRAGDFTECDQDSTSPAIIGYRQETWAILFGLIDFVSLDDLINTVKPNNFIAERPTMLV